MFSNVQMHESAHVCIPVCMYSSLCVGMYVGYVCTTYVAQRRNSFDQHLLIPPKETLNEQGSEGEEMPLRAGRSNRISSDWVIGSTYHCHRPTARYRLREYNIVCVIACLHVGMHAQQLHSVHTCIYECMYEVYASVCTCL